MRANLTSLVLALALVGCGGGDDSAPVAPPGGGSAGPAKTTGAPSGGSNGPAAAATTGGKQDWSDALGTATVSGSIKFEGSAPTRQPIDQSSDPNCHAETPLNEAVIVTADGGLQNVFVFVKKGLEGYKFPRGTGKVVLNQEGCQYKPHVFGMIKGQSLEIHNSDKTTHNVHSYSNKNTMFNRAQPPGPALEFEMKRSEPMFAIRCDMHAWMNCFVSVVDNQFFAVSDASGGFTLPKLPAGTYTVTAKHETLGKSSQEVTVADGETKAISFSFSAK